MRKNVPAKTWLHSSIDEAVKLQVCKNTTVFLASSTISWSKQDKHDYNFWTRECLYFIFSHWQRVVQSLSKNANQQKKQSFPITKIRSYKTENAANPQNNKNRPTKIGADTVFSITDQSYTELKSTAKNKYHLSCQYVTGNIHKLYFLSLLACRVIFPKKTNTDRVVILVTTLIVGPTSSTEVLGTPWSDNT